MLMATLSNLPELRVVLDFVIVNKNSSWRVRWIQGERSRQKHQLAWGGGTSWFMQNPLLKFHLYRYMDVPFWSISVRWLGLVGVQLTWPVSKMWYKSISLTSRVYIYFPWVTYWEWFPWLLRCLSELLKGQWSLDINCLPLWTAVYVALSTVLQNNSLIPKVLL